MYADDTCIIYADSDMTNIENKFQSDFDNILMLVCHDNGILINLDKTKCMYISIHLTIN